jgi:nucleoside-diphosphate-sugar epimerase
MSFVLNPVLQANLQQLVITSRDDLERLSEQRLLITGGTGFIGKWLLYTLREAELVLNTRYVLTIVSRSPENFLNQHQAFRDRVHWNWVSGDIKTCALPERVDQVFHGATEASAALNENNPFEMIDTITLGTRRLLRWCGETGVKKLFYLSSGAVYGQQPVALSYLPETYLGGPNCLDPKQAYAEAKRLAELECCIVAKQSSLKIPIARIFALTGAFLPLNAHFAMGNFIDDALHGRDIVIEGDGRPYRSYLYAADLITWLLAIWNRGQSQTAYNVGSDQALSIADLAQEVIRLVAPAQQVIIRGAQGAEDTVEAASRYIPDIRRAQADLGLSVSTSLERAILQTAQFYSHST